MKGALIGRNKIAAADDIHFNVYRSIRPDRFYFG